VAETAEEGIVPLSEEEARLLHQLEQSLAQEDPEFASALRGSTIAARNRRVAALAAVGFVVGMGVLFSGAVTARTWLGALGFIVMLGTGYVFTGAWRGGVAHLQGEPRAESGPRGSFVGRMEERWQRRQHPDR
jgi:hypothetical protein